MNSIVIVFADQIAVERVQRWMTHLVRPIRHQLYQERLKMLKLPSLYYHRRRGDMIKVYQILNGGINIDPGIFFQPPTTSITQGHPCKIRMPRAESQVKRNSFSAQTVKDWNTLPASVVCAKTVNQFKANLDSHWALLMHKIPT